jgi:hypothetical protein
MRRVMLIGYAIEPLRAEAFLHPACTPSVGAVLAAGSGNAIITSNEPGVCTPHADCSERL